MCVAEAMCVAGTARPRRFGWRAADFRRSLVIAEEVYGSKHPKVATRLNNIGTVSVRSRDLSFVP